MYTNEIVTSFLKFQDKILILRRNEHASAYKWGWGGVSGFLEKGENPIDRAMSGIKEETKLAGKDFELIREGASFSFKDKDEDVEIKWIIHPFIFRVKTNDIKIDEKHFDLLWIRPEELSQYFTVPKLKESLRRVLEASF